MTRSDTEITAVPNDAASRDESEFDVSCSLVPSSVATTICILQLSIYSALGLGAARNESST